MRVISGTSKGLNLDAPEGLDTRPTTDRVKESMFNIIMPWLPCENSLDLFGGSGALGIEALSRGGKSCVFVDKSRKAMEIIKKNAERARVSEKAKFEQKDVFLYLESCKEKFGIVFLDPPYNCGFLDKVFDIIQKRELLCENGIIVAERESGGEEINNENFERIKHAKYGKTTVSVFKYKENR